MSAVLKLLSSGRIVKGLSICILWVEYIKFATISIVYKYKWSAWKADSI